MEHSIDPQWIQLWESSHGKHLCCMCDHNRFIEYPETTIQHYADGYGCGIWRYEGLYPGPDRTEDNGGGFWLISCPYFVKMRDFYHCYMNSDAWKKKRNERLKLDNFKCQKCGSAMNLVVHHITYDRLGREPMEDLITLCQRCHASLHETDIQNKEYQAHMREVNKWLQQKNRRKSYR